ncbi:MAG: (deoxy)nucleoside triphosphate pyrophosphohydrolase [Planctomycetota bacterium]
MSSYPSEASLGQEQSHPSQHDAARPARVLITKRKAAQVLGGYWELPGGKVEPNEAAPKAVIRELREEVGIEVQPIDQLEQAEHHYDHAHVRLIPFICRWIAGTPQALEVDQVRWVSPHDLTNYAFPEASLPVIQSLTRWLERNNETLGAANRPATDTPALP